MKHLEVRYVGFWSGFNPETFFNPFLKSVLGYEIVLTNRSSPVDIEIVSVFKSRWSRGFEILTSIARGLGLRIKGPKSRLPSHDAKISIWYTGENVRPPLGEWDLTLSFDSDSKLLKNCYFPLWWQLFPEVLDSISRKQQKSSLKAASSGFKLDQFMSARVADIENRDQFACAIIGNPEPMRMHAIHALRHIGEVDIYGRYSGKYVENKGVVFKDYKFAVCFENSLYPGYVTEKLFDAWAAGCIPLWFGADLGDYINPSAVINLNTFSSMDEFVKEIAKLNSDEDSLAAIASRPLLLRKPDLGFVSQELISIVDRLVPPEYRLT